MSEQLQDGSTYADFCTEVRERTRADGVCLLVFGGERGNGFSVQVPIHIAARLPDLLRQMADQIEAKRGFPVRVPDDFGAVQ